ncbi:MAG: Nif3-like dinuclear metal center hexameric protein [Lachnospiraceae bacterium]|nr:Nif3-like dinuclear metal center hexameric protein [Lachnospiraceae bacterium]
MTIQTLREKLEELAPEALALDWDNSGFLVGDEKQKLHTVYLALDATEAAILAAQQCGAELLLTHHPLIFRGIARVTTEDFVGRRICQMLQSGISCQAMHTNFDVCVMGTLAGERLGLKELQPLEVTGSWKGKPCGIGVLGTVPGSLTLRECAALVKERFDLPQTLAYGAQEHRIQKLALVPGSGADEIPYALAAGADVLITGDISHHKGIDAWEQGLAVIDAGHYGLEHIFVDFMADYLGGQFPELKICKEAHKLPYDIIQ